MGVLADLHGTVLAVASSETAPARGLHVERHALDSALADAAAAAGADLRRGFEASGLASSFDAAAGMWTVRSTRSSFVGGGGERSGGGGGSGTGEVATGNEGGSIAARLLILADGSASTVGAELGFVVAAAASDNEAWRGAAAAAPPASRRRVASSGVPRSHGNHWLIVGEAAGHADARPAEAREGGEGAKVHHGIHTAMRGGELAAAAALSMRSRGDFSSSATRAYERAWRREFGASIVDAWPRAARRAVERQGFLFSLSFSGLVIFFLLGRKKLTSLPPPSPPHPHHEKNKNQSSRSDLLESLSGELRRLKQLASSKVSKAMALPPPPSLPPIEALLREKAGSAAAAARTVLESAAASAAAAARFGASMRTSWSGDGGGKSQEEESTAEAATASVEISLSPAGKGGGSNLAAALAAGAAEGAIASA